MRAIRLGEDAVLLECADAAEVGAAYAVARREVPDATDVVPAARTVLVDGVADPAALVAAAAGWQLSGEGVMSGSGRLVELPVRYDGADLPAVAELWNLSVEETIARHTALDYVVAFCGFTPGFAYCTGLPEEYAVPRLDTPRARVPAGSVGLASSWTGVYPSASPGGWRLLGTTDAPLWDPQRTQPALLSPGTRVRFVRV